MPRLSLATAARARTALLLTLAALATACSGPIASPIPEPTDRPTAAPVATPTTMPGGPLSGLGPLGKATYETPEAFVPTFAFDIRAEGWRSITEPDEFGFVLATPNGVQPDAFIGLVKPTATSMEQFTGEMGHTGFLDGTENVADRTIDGVAARSFSITRATSSEAFTIHTADGIVETSFGGDLPVNRFVYVAHTDGPFVVLLNAAADADVEIGFVFDALLESIAFR